MFEIKPLPDVAPGGNLEIVMFRGQHTPLPPSPPPEYGEKDMVRALPL